MRLIFLLAASLALSGCVTQVATPSGEPSPGSVSPSVDPRMAVANFVEVVDRVEPVAESVCQQQTPYLNCDFQILVENDPRAGVNAFHTVDPQGRPLIIYTIGLIAVAQNTDELAFVMGHEAGHHIAQHLPQQQVQANEGARVFGTIARQQGANAREVGQAARLGSFVASRRFGQQAELESDALGTAIAYLADYDPVRGAAFFTRLPATNDAFLSSHPPNAERQRIVRTTLEQLRRGTFAFVP